MILALVALELGALLVYAAIKGISVRAAVVSGDNKQPGPTGSIAQPSSGQTSGGVQPPPGVSGPAR